MLDTNVLVSGAFWSGASAKVLSLIEQCRIQLIVSRPILEEYLEAMMYDEVRMKVDSHHERIKAAHTLLQLGFVVHPTCRTSIITDDPDDNMFLDAAIEAHADCIVSQDKHLLRLQCFQGIPIMTPDRFLARSLKH